jgi:hypothetical protein
MKRNTIFKFFFYLPLGVSKEPGVLIILKSHSPLNVPGKNIPPSDYLRPPLHTPYWRDFSEPSVPYIFTDRK